MSWSVESDGSVRLYTDWQTGPCYLGRFGLVSDYLSNPMIHCIINMIQDRIVDIETHCTIDKLQSGDGNRNFAFKEKNSTFTF